MIGIGTSSGLQNVWKSEGRRVKREQRHRNRCSEKAVLFTFNTIQREEGKTTESSHSYSMAVAGSVRKSFFFSVCVSVVFF